jgi:thiamine monophosphate synthase
VAFTLPLLVIGGFSPDNASSVQKMGIIFGILSAIHCSLYSSKRVRVTARRI